MLSYFLIGFGIGVFLFSWKYSSNFPEKSNEYLFLLECGQMGIWMAFLGIILTIYG